MHHPALRFRQVHLDFHTSPAIAGVGDKFDKRRWQERLKRGHVDSITLFAKCHHGWSYHPTSVGKLHPHLSFDLLRRQYDATKGIGVNAPLYLSAGYDDLAGDAHPEWRLISPDGAYTTGSPLVPRFHRLDFHSPYLDYLCEQIREVVKLFPDCDGIFLDIISQAQSCTKWNLRFMQENGLDPTVEADRKESSRRAIEKYFAMSTAAAKSGRADMPVFHNNGHIHPGDTGHYHRYFSHLEIESLPTGGWGYDHFPAAAKYAQNLPHDFLGMTGKFHTTWGEFGGFKHPNALRYECSAMLAFGAKCSIGDQLHPSGELDESTYDLIGDAYREVEAKEPWCRDARNVADIGLLAAAAFHPRVGKEHPADTGANRILLEGHFLYTVIDRACDFTAFRLLILPDDVPVDDALKAKLEAYLAQGGCLLLTGSSGLARDGSGFRFDLGAEDHGPSEFEPDYILPREDLRAPYVKTPQVMYLRSRRIKVTSGESLGEVFDPYFNRSYKHFCSHQHTPNKPAPSGFACGVRKGNIVYLAHPVFTIYRRLGATAYRHYATAAIRLLLADDERLTTNLPSTARVSLTTQPAQRRLVLHLLHANTISRGGPFELSGGNIATRASGVEVIEDFLPLHDIDVSLRVDAPVARVTFEPQGAEVAHDYREGRLHLKIASFVCHQMVAVHLA